MIVFAAIAETRAFGIVEPTAEIANSIIETGRAERPLRELSIDLPLHFKMPLIFEYRRHDKVICAKNFVDMGAEHFRREMRKA